MVEKMNFALEDGQRLGWNQARFAEELKAIIRAEKQTLKSGERELNKHRR